MSDRNFFRPRVPVPETFYEVLATCSVGYQEIEKEHYNNIEEAIRSKHGVTFRYNKPFIFGLPVAFVLNGVLQEDMDPIVKPEESNFKQGSLSLNMPQWTSKDGKYRYKSSFDDKEEMAKSSENYMSSFDYNAIPIDMVKRIDIITSANAVIFRSRKTQTGIIAITTKTGKELQESGQGNIDQLNIKVANPLGYQKPAEFYSPAYDTPPQRLNAHERDLRTTLYWNPKTQPLPDGRACIEFFAADEAADYTITIEGVSDENCIVQSINKITKKN